MNYEWIRNKTSPKWLIMVVLIISIVSKQAHSQQDELRDSLDNRLNAFETKNFLAGDFNYFNTKKIELDSLFYSENEDTLTLIFNKALAEMPVREEIVKRFQDSLISWLPEGLTKPVLRIISNNKELYELVPNYYRTKLNTDIQRLFQADVRPERKNVVSRLRPYQTDRGLKNANIALWNSHGWYYEPKLDRWEWQRARLFTSLEDISPTAFVVPYIAPMLENAGANVFIPRERDWQTNEVIVDNNGSTGKSKFKRPKKRGKEIDGFAIGNPHYVDENPFLLGTSVTFTGRKKENIATYIPDIPEAGEYGVYVSYGKGEGPVTYRIYHSGGITDFRVDQQMGFNTWIYLDKFKFNKGLDKETGKVELIIPENTEKQFSADAVKFGGGMGSISRNGKTGERARYFEGARYYLQYSGAPDTLVWNLSNGENDYTDDYKSRGEWVNWLLGAPYGPTGNRQYPGLNIPVDMALAFHTDAGILPDSGIVGTLGIYSTEPDSGYFPDGQSKYASRDLTDLIQTQIVEDISHLYNCNWSRRGMWNSQYSEAFRPNVPTMLLELLSHQNLNDVRYVLNPKFRFDVSRAIYKGMLRFLAVQNGYRYQVQPLPVDHLTSEFVGNNTVKLKWEPVSDKLEPTATPEKYVVYKRVGENGFDNGVVVEKPEVVISDLEKGKIYGFKVTAVNGGGESFPSEIVSVGMAENSKGEVLIVNGFDRIDGPAIFDTDSLSGVLRQLDHGVAYGYDLSTVGDQYDFDKKSAWLDDDSPGHGASFADLETTIFRGNTFDFSFVHGKSIMAAGYSFVTSSDEAVEKGLADLNKFPLVDLLYGEEKTSYMPGKDATPYFSIYTEEMISALENYTKNGGDIFISGAYIGSEIPKDTSAVSRIGKILKFKWRTDHAVKTGSFRSVSNNFNFAGEFNTGYNLEQYPVESPDGIEPYDEDGETVFRYGENHVSAGVFYNGEYKVAALGFPFESVKNQKARDDLMEQIVNAIFQR